MPRPKGLPRTGGRKKGTLNKATADVKVAAAVYTPAAISTLASIMSNEGEPAQARVAAARELLDRGHGKPAQALAMTGEVLEPGPRIIFVAAAQAREVVDADPNTPTVVLPDNGREAARATEQRPVRQAEPQKPAPNGYGLTPAIEPVALVPTVRVRTRDGRVRIINRSDFDPAVHVLAAESTAAGCSVENL